MCQRVTIIEIAKIAVMTQWVRTGALNRGDRSTYSGPPFKANVNLRNMARTAAENASSTRGAMTIRVATIEVSHWHALNDAAYLRHLIAMPDVELVAIQDSDASLVARRAAEVGSPPTFTNYRQMLSTTRPDFVVALGRHRQMARIAHDLLDEGYPFLMEKPMGINAPEVEALAEKAARLNAFIAVSSALCAVRHARPRTARRGAL